MDNNQNKKNETWVKKDDKWVKCEKEEIKITGLSSGYIAELDEDRARHYGIDYCVGCKRRVQLVKKPFNFVAAVLGFMFFGFGLVLYLIYHLLKPRKYCALCRMKISEW